MDGSGPSSTATTRSLPTSRAGNIANHLVNGSRTSYWNSASQLASALAQSKMLLNRHLLSSLGTLLHALALSQRDKSIRSNVPCPMQLPAPQTAQVGDSPSQPAVDSHRSERPVFAASPCPQSLHLAPKVISRTGGVNMLAGFAG